MSDCQINIPTDTVIGQKKFGGFVYALTTSFGGSQSVSTLKLSIVTEKNANFILPTLKDYSSIEQIPVGNGKSFSGYPSSYSSHKTADKRILEVTYIDGSILLDRFQIGLLKRHNEKKGKFGNLIVLGKEYHPCDKNFDSTVDYTPQEGAVQIDWCDPAPFCPPEKYKDSCAKQTKYSYVNETGKMEIGAILPVRYTFNELLDALKTAGVKVGINSMKNDKGVKSIPAEYTGALREVLSSWCGDYGFTFYWDYFNDTINFVDIKTPVSITFDYESVADVTQLTESETLENTSSTTFLTYYERDGVEQSYTCADDRIVGCSPIFYKDILDATGKKGDEISTKGEKSWDSGMGQKEMACALAYYNQSLWECFLFFNVYNIFNSTSAYDLKNMLLTHLGNMKILEVASAVTDDLKAFTSFLYSLNKEEASALVTFNNDANNIKNGLYYYFAVVSVDPSALNQRYSKDQEIAQNLMGKFWFRKYSPAICGGAVKNTKVSIQTTDGSGQFYEFGKTFSGHALTKFGFAEESKIGKLVKDAVTDSSDPIPMKFQERSYKTSSSFMMVEREAKWYPNSTSIEDYEGTFAYYKENQTFKFVGTDGRPEALLIAYPKAKTDKNIRLILCKSLKKGSEDNGGLKITESKTDNFYETKGMQELKRTRYQDRKSEPYKEQVIGAVGLTHRSCKWVTFDGFGFMMPVGASFYSFKDGWSEEYTNFGSAIVPSYIISSDPLPEMGSTFRVRVSQEHDNKTYLPKIQIVNGVATNDKTRKHQLILHQFSEDVKADGYCGPDLDKIKTRHEELKAYSTVQNISPQKTVSFSAVGVFPVVIDIAQGLDSFSITFDDSGITTEYSLSNKYAQPIPIDSAKRLLSQWINKSSLRQTSKGAEIVRGEPEKLNIF